MIMNRTKIFTMILVSGVALLAAIAGRAYSGERKLRSSDESESLTRVNIKMPVFTGIKANGCSDVVFIPSAEGYSVTVAGNFEDPMYYVDVRIDGSTLTISRTDVYENERKNSKYQSAHPADENITVYVRAPWLESVTISGIGDFICDRYSSDSPLELIMSGTGDARFEQLRLRKCEVDMKGTGDFKADYANISDGALKVTGTGTIDVAKIDAEDLELTVRGTGDIRIPALKVYSLDATVSGTGELRISGECDGKARYTCSGSGDIDARNLVARTVVATSSGTGTLECYASESFQGSNKAPAVLHFFGRPGMVRTTGLVHQN